MNKSDAEGLHIIFWIVIACIYLAGIGYVFLT